MGDAADWLRECEENFQFMHDIGDCRDPCALCDFEERKRQMSTTITAFVEKVFRNERQGQRGPYTLYSFKIQDPQSGKVDDIYYNCGFDDPGVKEGDYVRFEAAKSEKSAKGWDVTKDSVKVSNKPPARPENPEPYQKKGGGGAKGGGGWKKDPATQKAISYQAARKDALVLVQILLEHDGLPVAGGSGKAAKAKRFEEIGAFVDKLTVRLFNDTDTLRLLESIDDSGVVEFPEAGDAAEEIDSQVSEQEQAETTNDEGFDDDGF